MGRLKVYLTGSRAREEFLKTPQDERPNLTLGLDALEQRLLSEHQEDIRNLDRWEAAKTPEERIGLIDPKNIPTEAHFVRFHMLNPGIFERAKDLSLQAKRDYGKAAWSCEAVLSVVRWNLHSDAFGERCRLDDGEFAINSRIIPHYSRLLMLTDSELFWFYKPRRIKPCTLHSLWQEKVEEAVEFTNELLGRRKPSDDDQAQGIAA